MFPVLARSLARRTILQCRPPPPQKFHYPSRGVSNRQTTTAKEDPLPTSTSEVVVEPTLDVNSSKTPSIDVAPPELQKEFQRTGARSSKGSLSSSDQRRRFMGRITMAFLAIGVGAHVVYMGREWTDEELKFMKTTRESAPSTRTGRTKERYKDIFDYFNKPAWSELLPPALPSPHQKPYTLLLSIDDLLVTSTWDREHGWRTAKRPGVDYFLGYISQFYEVVIFTSQPYYTAAPILDKLDRYGFFINHRLYREATHFVQGKIVKDLTYLNRDLSKVVLLDTHPEHVSSHPENSIVIPKWTGDPKDKGLVAMIPFLESIAIYKPPDVRPILKAYEGKNIPIEYGKREAEMKAKHVDEWKAKNQHTTQVPSSFKGLFGFSNSASPSTMTTTGGGGTGGPPPTYLEQKRSEAQKQYSDEQKYIKDNKSELERLLDQDQQMMASQVPNNLWEAIDQLRGVAPPPPPTPPTTPSAPSTPTPTGVVGAISNSGSSNSASETMKKA